MSTPEFDGYSKSYEELLKDPLRDLFASDGCSFFHQRKRDLILDYFGAQRISPANLNYMDLGCGKGELLQLLQPKFAVSCGCDPSADMMAALEGVEKRLQANPLEIPYGNAQFDFVTAVCVFHHVEPRDRVALMREVRRVLRPGGIFCVIEHNPYNPATRMIVKRTPVDANAILLTAKETRTRMRDAGFTPRGTSYFLYFPERAYAVGKGLERLLQRVPLGGQYAVFGFCT